MVGLAATALAGSLWGLLAGFDVAPHVAALPGLAVFLSVLGFNPLGDGLLDALGPRFR